MGQNGAGKSTLIKVLTGVLRRRRRRDAAGGPADPARLAARGAALGISTVYQEVNLCPNLSVAENIFAGRYPRRGAGAGLSHRLGGGEPRCARAAGAAGPGHRRHAAAVELFGGGAADGGDRARAGRRRRKVLILDEPTSSLDDDEVQEPVRGAAPAARRRPGDPVRHALPEPGLCGVRPHHGAAQRQLGRRMARRASWARRR